MMSNGAMKTKTPNKYVFDTPDPDAAAREKARLAAEAVSGNYSVETYKERLAEQRRQAHDAWKNSPEGRAELRRVKAFNRSWKRRRQRGYRCTTPDCPCPHVFHTPTKCYHCRKAAGELPVVRVPDTKKPEQVTTDSLRPQRSRNALLL